MKKVLSVLLSLLMVVSCMAGITFSVAAEATTVLLYGEGTEVGNMASNRQWANGAGQIFTVAEGKMATAIEVNFSVPSGDGAAVFYVYRWDSSKTYAQNTAEAPLYSEEFYASNMAWSTFNLAHHLSDGLTGTLYWEYRPVDSYANGGNGYPTVMGASSIITENGDITGIQNVTNGNVGGGCTGWDSANTLRARVVVDEVAADTVTDVPLLFHKLYKGNRSGNILVGTGWSVTNYGQKFEVPDGQKLRTFTQQLATDDTAGEGRISFYVWDTNYSTTLSFEPIYSTVFAVSNNQYLNVIIPEDVTISGTVLWKIDVTSGSVLAPYGSTALGDNVVDYINGQLTNQCGGSYNVSGWSGSITFNATIGTAGTSESISLFNTLGASQYNAKSKATIGQSFSVPKGKILTSINIRYMCTENYAGTATGKFALYQWAGDYNETVSRAPLYSFDVSYGNNTLGIKWAIPASLMVEGEVLWTLTPDESSATGFAPWGAKDQIEGVHSYCNGVKDKGLNNYGEFIESSITYADGGLYREVETTTTDLWTVNGASQYNAKSKATIGQSIVIPDGKALTSIYIPSTCTENYSGTATGKFALYQWDTDYATTVAGTPLYSFEVSYANNTTEITWSMPDDLLVTGEVLWTLTPDESSATGFAPWGAKDQIAGVHSYCNGVKDKGLNNYGEYIKSSITTIDVENIYINSIDKSVIYSGAMTFGQMLTGARDIFRAKANAFANGTWGAWDGTFTQVGNVFYTNHTYENNVTADGAAVELEGNSAVVEAAPYKDEAKFLYWADANGNVITDAPSFKWFPKSADDAIVAVYEGEAATLKAPTVEAERVDGDTVKLVVTVTPSHLSTYEVTEYGYYISVGTEISASNVAGTKVTANEVTSAYLQHSYSLKPASAAQTIYVMSYVTLADGTTIYGTAVAA